MASNEKWLRRTLDKLNELVLDGYDFNDQIWVFDWNNKLTTDENLTNVRAEDAALETLTQSQVIKSRVLPNRRHTEQLQRFNDPYFANLPEEQKLIYGDWYDVQPALRKYEWIRALDGFDKKAYNSFMKQLDEASGDISATLTLRHNQQPVIKAKGKEYPLAYMDAGAASYLVIREAYALFGKPLAIDQLRQKINHTRIQKKDANLRQIFKKNVFREGGVLGSFATIETKEITLQRKALLTTAQLEAIRHASIN